MSANQKKYDAGVGVTRLLAMCMIIACHFMQFYGSALAWWFNVGVQIFLCISGFLYGQRDIPNGFAFISRNLKKILLDYYVYVLLCLIPYAVFQPALLTPTAVIDLLLCNVTISGIDHLWFIPYILVCYLMTPLLNRLRLALENKKAGLRVLAVVGMVLLLELLCDIFVPYFTPVWISCYIVGYFFGAQKKRAQAHGRYGLGALTAVFSALALLFNGVQLSVDLFGLFTPQGLFGTYYYRFCNYAHLFLGVAIFLLLHAAFHRVQFTKVPWLLRFSDRYSYDIYLAHQVYVQGALNLQAITAIPLLSGGIIVVLIIFSGILLNLLCNLLRKKIPFLRENTPAKAE